MWKTTFLFSKLASFELSLKIQSPSKNLSFTILRGYFYGPYFSCFVFYIFRTPQRVEKSYFFATSKRLQFVCPSSFSHTVKCACTFAHLYARSPRLFHPGCKNKVWVWISINIFPRYGAGQNWMVSFGDETRKFQGRNIWTLKRILRIKYAEI